MTRPVVFPGRMHIAMNPPAFRRYRAEARAKIFSESSRRTAAEISSGFSLPSSCRAISFLTCDRPSPYRNPADLGRIASLAWMRLQRIAKCEMLAGGEGGIRTPDTVARMPHFECGAFNHSATSPLH